jgi:hypothetical protein
MVVFLVVVFVLLFLLLLSRWNFVLLGTIAATCRRWAYFLRWVGQIKVFNGRLLEWLLGLLGLWIFLVVVLILSILRLL